MLFTPYALTDKVRRSVTDDGSLIMFNGLTTAGKEFHIFAVLADAQRWANGELIQVCFPYLNADDREILMTGIDSESWEEMFAGSEEEEE